MNHNIRRVDNQIRQHLHAAGGGPPYVCDGIVDMLKLLDEHTSEKEVNRTICHHLSNDYYIEQRTILLREDVR